MKATCHTQRASVHLKPRHAAFERCTTPVSAGTLFCLARPGRCLNTDRSILACSNDASKETSTSTAGAESPNQTGIGLKAVWYGAEQFGKFAALGRNKKSASTAETTPEVQVCCVAVVVVPLLVVCEQQERGSVFIKLSAT